jgi:hypothetical protein
MGFLDTFLGNGDQTQALGLLGAQLMAGNAPGGFLAAQQHMAGADDRRLRKGLLEAQLQETLAQADERKTIAAQRQAELQRQAAIRQAMPGLYQQPGWTGGEAMPQSVGGVPMFGQPVGAAPMRQTPGGFDVQRAIALGMNPDEITKYAGLQNLGRSKVARTVEVDDGKGGKATMQLDEFGQPIGSPLAGYIAPVSVNQGDRQTFVRPSAGLSLPVGMSPAERDASARGWAGERRQAAQAEQGKWQYDAQRGGLVNMQSGEFKPATQNGQPVETKASREAAKEDLQRKSALANADSVLKEVRDAKGLVGWNTAGVGGVLANVPATEARDLSAKLQTIKANLGFDRLQQMRAESPTGGALGQVAVQELAALQATVASLDQLQGSDQLGTALDKIENHYTNWKNVMRQAQSGQGGTNGGWGIKEKL